MHFIVRKIPFYIHWMYRKIVSTFICLRFSETRNVFFDGSIDVKGSEFITIGEKTKIGKGVIMSAWDSYNKDTFTPSIKIGKGCNIGDYNHITCINEIVIGDNLLTGRWVTFSDNNHGTFAKELLVLPPTSRPLVTKGKIQIGDNVWIGEKSTILSGITIGEGCIIAANSVVNKSVPPFSMVAGIPAKIIKTIN